MLDILERVVEEVLDVVDDVTDVAADAMDQFAEPGVAGRIEVVDRVAAAVAIEICVTGQKAGGSVLRMRPIFGSN